MTSKGNQATFLLPPEPQGSHPRTQPFIRGDKKDRRERVAVYYDNNYKAFGLQYSPQYLGTALKVATAQTVENLIGRLAEMGFKPL